MIWTYITDDPATLPPLDVPVFVQLENGEAVTAERYSFADDWRWAICDYAPYIEDFTDRKWTCGGSSIADIQPIAWHPLPELPKLC